MNEMVLVQFRPLAEALEPVLHVLVLLGMVVLLIEAAVLLGNLIGVGDHSRNGS
jgi:hypothetical protein